MKRYSLGSIREHTDYFRTNMVVGNFFPALYIQGIRKGKEQDSFDIHAGFPFGFASEKKVKEYLSTVSKYLQE